MDIDKKTQFNIWYWFAAFLGLMLFQYLFTTVTQVARIPYSQFETYLAENRIAEVAVSDRFIQGRFREPVDGSTLPSSDLNGRLIGDVAHAATIKDRLKATPTQSQKSNEKPCCISLS
jgi:hypothetical protein